MKKLMIVFLLPLIACSTNKKSITYNESEDNSLNEDRMIGPDLPSWVLENEIVKGDRLFLVGNAEMSPDKSEYHIKKAAIMDGEIRLISDAPSKFRVISQSALNGAGVESSDFKQIQTKLQEAIGVIGLKNHDTTCRKFVRHGESRSFVIKSCWALVSTSISDLKRAYALTLERLYGIKTSAKFENLMEKEIEKINVSQIQESKNETPNVRLPSSDAQPSMHQQKTP